MSAMSSHDTSCPSSLSNVLINTLKFVCNSGCKAYLFAIAFDLFAMSYFVESF